MDPRPAPPGKVRLREVAEAAGLSVSGVSRALNGDLTMAPATRARVQSIARRLGYKPDAAARSLRDSARGSAAPAFRGTLAYVVTPHEAAQMREPRARERYPWHFEITDRAALYGYSVDRFAYDPESAEQRELLRVLPARGIRGAVFSGNGRDLRAVRLHWDQLAAVTLSAIPGSRFLHNLSISYFQDAYLATQKLVERGYRRIALVLMSGAPDAILGGYEVALQLAGLPIPGPLRAGSGVPRAFASWMRRAKPDCLLTMGGPEYLVAVRELGLRVPQDLGVAFLDDLDAPGELSGLHQPREQLLRWGVDLVHTMLTHNEFGPPADPVEMQFASLWREGGTIRPPVPSK